MLDQMINHVVSVAGNVGIDPAAIGVALIALAMLLVIIAVGVLMTGGTDCHYERPATWTRRNGNSNGWRHLQ